MAIGILSPGLEMAWSMKHTEVGLEYTGSRCSFVLSFRCGILTFSFALNELNAGGICPRKQSGRALISLSSAS